MISIDPHSGLITLTAPLDREANETLSFTVVATDNGPNPLFSEAEVVLKVRDYNDNPPVFNQDIYITNGKHLQGITSTFSVTLIVIRICL